MCCIVGLHAHEVFFVSIFPLKHTVFFVYPLPAKTHTKTLGGVFFWRARKKTLGQFFASFARFARTKTLGRESAFGRELAGSVRSTNSNPVHIQPFLSEEAEGGLY